MTPQVTVTPEQRLSLLADNAEDYAFFLVDTAGRIAEWPDSAKRLLGWDAQEAVGQSCAITFTPEDQAREAHKTEMEVASRAGSAADNRWHQRRDGSRIFVEGKMSALRDNAGKLLCFGKVFRNVTESHITGARLQESEDKYRFLFNSIDEGFCIIEVILDGEGRPHDYRFLEVNPAFERHTGLKDSENRTMRELAPDLESYWFDIYGKVALTGQSIRFVNSAAALGNRWFDVFAFKVGAPGERRVAILFTDITERKNLERELAEASSRKDEFLALLAHELRNPLAPLANSLAILKQQDVPKETLSQLREMMTRQVEQLTRLVDDLLDVARVNSGKVTLQKHPIALLDVVTRAVELNRPLLETKDHTLSVEVAPMPVLVDGDTVRLAQAVGNLLNNAAKYTNSGGRITISAGQENGFASIRVTDNGIGISADMLPNVFDMFTQAESGVAHSGGGLGIGLALVRKLVEMHGGSVHARSAGLGQGSEFEIRLPTTEKTESSSSASTNQHHPRQQRRILVVDDNADSCESMALFLKLDGHEVATAHTGPDAIQMIRSFRPAIAVIDVGLPGCDGYEVARTVRKEFPSSELCLVAATGYGQAEDRRKSRDAGFDWHLVKPVDMTAVEEIIEHLWAPGTTAGAQPV